MSSHLLFVRAEPSRSFSKSIVWSFFTALFTLHSFGILVIDVFFSLFFCVKFGLGFSVV